jgi:flagellar biosynthesis/type III secretory pathway M-ring protein FliF/YscJ
MKINEFHVCWHWARLIVVAFGAILMLFTVIKAHSYTLEMEYRGPGSENERLSRDTRDRENSEAHDRVRENERNGRESSQRDKERSYEHERDHAV